MKQISENRAIAWVVFAACVLFSLTFSSGRALSNLRADNEAVFYTGVQENGLSINNDLAARAKCAYDIASTAGNYASIDGALVQAAKDAADGLEAAKTIPDKQRANVTCQRAVSDLYTAMENVSLSASDQSFAFKQYKEFTSRAETIKHNEYNQYATEFNRDLVTFPASFLVGLIGIQHMALFQ